MSKAYELELFAIRVEDIPEDEINQDEVKINNGTDKIIEVPDLINNIIADNSDDIPPTRPNSPQIEYPLTWQEHLDVHELRSRFRLGDVEARDRIYLALADAVPFDWDNDPACFAIEDFDPLDLSRFIILEYVDDWVIGDRRFGTVRLISKTLLRDPLIDFGLLYFTVFRFLNPLLGNAERLPRMRSDSPDSLSDMISSWMIKVSADVLLQLQRNTARPKDQS